MERKMVRGYTVEKNQPWFTAMKKQDYRCARCEGMISPSIRKAQKERWMINGIAYCGTCSVIIKEEIKNDKA